MSGFGRILEDLNAAEVDYVLVGGIAMIRYGVVRATRDIHLATPEGDLDPLSDKIAGIPFPRPRERAEVKHVDGVPAPICSLTDLVTMKRAAGRERDLADLSDLEAAHGELPTAGS